MSNKSGDTPQLSRVTSISERAEKLAQSLLEAYYYQDKRESYLLQEKPDKARDTAAQALSKMATVYESEFEDRSPQRARLAGEEFMKGLFLQDEIENWDLLTEISSSDHIHKALYSDIQKQYGPRAGKDERWERVRNHLNTTCELVGINETYAAKQTHFWLLHGQLNEYWEKLAKEAHTVKLRAMVPHPSDGIEDRLGELFVEGVNRHNKWDHRDRERDLNSLQGIVAQYYQRILDLRIDGENDD